MNKELHIKNYETRIKDCGEPTIHYSLFTIRDSCRSGFTVIELITAMSVFVLAMSIITGVFIEIMKTQRITNSLMEANSNAGLMIEQMAREMRLGYGFTTSTIGNCPENFSENLTFLRYRGGSTTTVVYSYNMSSSSIERSEGGSPTSAMTPSSVSVNRLCFWVNPEVINANGNREPWRVTILTKIAPRNEKLTGRGVDLQTTVSARILPTEVK
ncbi:MAG: type II secretion system protein [Candidatus Paceibacterota bacterium]|jgi:prepilin-type N-terminal cleavage/methylation domain-containing protein